MLEQDDLDAAVAEGIVTRAQADALCALGARRKARNVAVHADEERFRFMRGFNDFFFAVGIVLLGSGLAYFASPDNALSNIAAAGLIWGLAELLVGRMRLVLPGILLAALFAFFALRAAPGIDLLGGIAGARPPVVTRPTATIILGGADAAGLAFKAIVAAALALVFYARFRLPFALLLVAASLVIAVETIAARLLDFTPAVASLVTLGCGLAVFAAAMHFDLSDRDRVTRRADCAFWLHLLASPLIVHSLILMLAPNMKDMTANVALTVVAITAVLTLVAILIDRRALLVSALVYLGAVIGYAITGTAADKTAIFFATLVILGVLVLTIGVAWFPLRRALVRLLPPVLVNRLPSTVPA
jgi:hypothetical protein